MIQIGATYMQHETMIQIEATYMQHETMIQIGATYMQHETNHAFQFSLYLLDLSFKSTIKHSIISIHSSITPLVLNHSYTKKNTNNPRNHTTVTSLGPKALVRRILLSCESKFKVTDALQDQDRWVFRNIHTTIVSLKSNVRNNFKKFRLEICLLSSWVIKFLISSLAHVIMKVGVFIAKMQSEMTAILTD